MDRLHRLSPTYRVHWFPQYGETGARWVIADHRANPEYQAMGWYQLTRFESAGLDTPENVYGALLICDGDHIVATFTEEQIWTEYFWRHLETLDAARDKNKKLLDQSIRRREQQAVSKEIDANPEFHAVAEDIAKEAWGFHMQGRHSVA